MDEEMIIIETEEVVDDEVISEDIEQSIKHQETIQYIEVEDATEMEIDIEEGVGWAGGDVTKHFSLDGRNDPDQHDIVAIKGLKDKLEDLGKAKDLYTINGGIAEFRRWKDNGEGYKLFEEGESEAHLGYFVGLDRDGCIEICNDELLDVYGVTVGHSGICGYQNSEYNILHSGNNKATSTLPFTKVCMLGTVDVRFGDTSFKYEELNVGDYVIPNKNGCAIKSDNNIGFRVVMKKTGGFGQNALNIVQIALVPQNDNLARIIKETNKGLGSVIEGLKDLTETVDKNISISGKFEEFEKSIDSKVDIVETTIKEVKETSDEFDQKLFAMNEEYEKIKNTADTATQKLESATKEVAIYREQLEPIVTYGKNIAGFFGEANENGVTIGSLAQGLNDANAGLSMIKQSNDAIQNLVCSVDLYSVGYQSPTFGLSREEAGGALGGYGYIYVPTQSDTEKSYIYRCVSTVTKDTDYCFNLDDNIYVFTSPDGYNKATLEYNARTNELTITPQNTQEPEKIKVKKIEDASGIEILEGFQSIWVTEFEQGISYKWVYDTRDNKEHYWEPNGPVLFEENPPNDQKGELWFTPTGSSDKKYPAGTLYRRIKSDNEDNSDLWVAVATVNDNNARTTSLINQTAESLSATIANLEGQVADVELTVNGFSTTIDDAEKSISQINQTAEDILLGVYSKEGGASSLEVLLDGLRSDAVYVDNEFVVKVLEQTAVAIDGKYYADKPTWNGKEFVFVGEASAVQSSDYPYCFASESKQKYYRNVSGGYEVYTYGNTAIASLNTRVTDTESEIESWTNFKTEVSDTMTKITQSSSADVAEMAHIVMGKFLNKVESISYPTEEQLADLKIDIPSGKPPIWKDGYFFFESGGFDGNQYCLSLDEHSYYHVMRDDDDNIIGYDKYEMKSSDYASIVQKVEDGKSYVGLVAGDDDNMGSIVVNTINDKSEILIEADKIGINGFTVFRDNLADGTTTISGNYIKTGIITSNDYSGPVTYKMYEAKIFDNYVYSFANGVREYEVYPITGATKIVLNPSEHFIGMDLNIEPGTYCYQYNNEWLTMVINLRERVVEDIRVYEYYCNDIPSYIPDGTSITVYFYTAANDKTIYKGSKTDCIYYVPKVRGTLSIGKGYYYATDIKILGPLITKQKYDELSEEQQNSYIYIVSENDFELVPSDIEIEGMKIDLDLGTIYSKNLILDTYGDLSVTGKITATSGYIGSESKTGMSIQCHDFVWSYTIPKEGLSAGNYYIANPLNNKYYMFSTDTLESGVKIVLFYSRHKKDIDGDYDCNITIDGVPIDFVKTNDIPSNCIELNAINVDSKNIYYLGNNQITYDGKILAPNCIRGSQGVYVGPDGIGLGNGNFWVSPEGISSISDITFRYFEVFDYVQYDDDGKPVKNDDGSYVFEDIGPATAMDISGVLSMGTWSPVQKYHHSGLIFDPGRSLATEKKDAQLEVYGTISSYNCTEWSDSRLKTNIVDTEVNAVELIKKIETKSFDWINNGKHVDVGLIAQQLEKVIPNLVVTNERTGLKSIDFTKLIPYLIKAIQELSDAVYPPVEMMSLDGGTETDTHWVDDMGDDEKQYYVELSMPPKFKSK